MKFLDSFKMFENRSISTVTQEEIFDMLDTVEDIFLELKDNGLTLNYGGTFVNFRITKKREFFQLDNDVFDVVVRICNYLDTIDYMKFNQIKIESTPSQMHKVGRARGESEFTSLESFEKYAPIGGKVLTIEIKYDEIRY